MAAHPHPHDVPALSRRSFLKLSAGLGASLAAGWIPISPFGLAQARPLTLTPLDTARPLTPKVFGASVEALIDPVLNDPRKIAAIKATAPAMVRFPGGSQSNYYDWRTGLLNFPVLPDSSAYVKYWAAIAPKIARTFPNGVKYEQYAPFAAGINADTMLVPNLETSTIEEQTAWFTQIKAAGLPTPYIELGNEFYLAMAGDPASLKRWPDNETALAVQRRYVTALRPLTQPNAKFAVQSAASLFDTLPTDPRPFRKRWFAWDAALHPADWFEAVTAHLYPEVDEIAKAEGNPDAHRLFELVMARIDGGGDRALNDIATRLPGKEIWVTEWNPRGGTPPDASHPELVTPPMALHLTARYLMMYLRHPAVTKALYFMLFTTDGNPFQAYVKDANGDFAPLPATIVLSWFMHAANGGGSFQRIGASDGKPLAGVRGFTDSYLPIEGALFKSDSSTTLILQNASDEARLYDPTDSGTRAHPRQIDLLVSDDFANATHTPATITSPDVAQPLLLPPFSIARIMW